jgi:hypothetical protein
MITVNDILVQFQTLKAKINAYYTLIYNEVNVDADLSGLTSTSKTSEFNLWMWMFAIMSAIMDEVWADRQQQISDKVALGIPGTDRWLQVELFKFQYGDSLLWDDVTGRYYYAVIDPTKQIIKRCAVISSGGITAIKVAKLSGGNLVALTDDELTAFRSYVRQIQWAGSKILNPVSFSSDKLNAPMTVYYDGVRKINDIKAIVESAWVEYLSKLPFNAEYSLNKHGDFVENASVDIREVQMGAVQARANAGSFVSVNRVFTPISGYLERDPAISFNDMINYVAV